MAEPVANPLQTALTFFAELAQVLASNSKLQPILDWMVQRSTAMLSADEGSIKLLETGTQNTPHTIVRRGPEGMESGSWERPVSLSVMGYLMMNPGVLSTPDLLADPRFPGLKNVSTRVRAVLAAPLRVENRISGMLAVTNRTPGRVWTPEEAQLLGIVASHSGEAIDKARVRDEIDQARETQMNMVPSKPLRVGPWEADGRVLPARQVGGDYFDYFPLDQHRFGVTIADVSGKGLPAAMLMSNVQASLRAFCDGGLGIPEALGRVNRGLSRTIAPGKFITLFYGEVDTRGGLLRYSNAGHNYPLIRRGDGTLVELGVGGPVLGPFESAHYDLAEIDFAPGDGLLLYSDGIVDATDDRGRMFEEDRLREAWKQCAALTPVQSVEYIMDTAQQFQGSAPQADDMTALVVGPHSR